MHFDDRLATVLRARSGGEASARTQFRQLIDLLGTLPSAARGPQIDAAYVQLDALAKAIPAAERAQALAEPGLRLRSARLLAQLAQSEPAVAVAAMRAAHLSEAEWLDLVPALPVPARIHVRHRRDLGPRLEALLTRLGIADRGLPPATAARQAANDPGLPSTAPLPPPSEGIGAIVQRIEAYRKRKADGERADTASGKSQTLAAQAALRAPLVSFGFASDEVGRITWADTSAAPSLIGLKITARDQSSPVAAPQELADAFRRRQPIRVARIELDGAPAIAGDWQVDATPQFDTHGRFTGYLGRFRRQAAPGSQGIPARADSEADRIRQLLHELRTPVNAIQGFAEVIQQQLFSPTPHEYRAHAAAIAGDAARMLAGFDELERLAQLDSGAMTLDAGSCDFVAVVAGIISQLEAHTARRDSGFVLEADLGAMPVSLAQPEAERLVWRLLATLAGASAPGERLKLRLRRKSGAIRLTVALPQSLANQSDLFHVGPPSTPSPLSAGMFGAGFALRLATSEAKAGGGKLQRREGKLRLELPQAVMGETSGTAAQTEYKGLAS